MGGVAAGLADGYCATARPHKTATAENEQTANTFDLMVKYSPRNFLAGSQRRTKKVYTNTRRSGVSIAG
jgi:hypothetical protein